MRDAIDASAPIDADAVKLLRKAESLIADSQWERAQEVLLFTLDRAGGALVRLRDGRVSSVADEANHLLGEFPDRFLDLYRRQYGTAARKTLDEAIESGRRDLVEQVATQFRHTEAGREAVLRIAATHFDRGEFGLAAARYRQLATGDLAPGTRIRAAYAAAASGDVEESERLFATLTDADRESLPSQVDLDRLVATAAQQTEASRVADGWLLPQGDATGAAVAAAGEPALLRRWSHPLTHRSQVQAQIDQVTQDLRDEGRATISASVPLAIGGHVVARTLRGVAVYAAADGRLLWETADEDSPERLLAAGGGIDADMQQVIRFRFQFGQDLSGPSNEFAPLVDLLYRDGVYGFLSSDGERVFAVTDQSPLARPEANFWHGRPETEGRGSAASNRLVAYDLATGRPAWPGYAALGGLVEGGPFEPPLAGYTFFGPPTPSDGELYVVGEKDKEIRLIALDPATGSVRWDRLIAHAQAGVDQDPVRRGWPAQVAVSGGVLVCPTTVGWLVGIDRSSRSILWAYRYAPPQPGGDANDGNPATPPSTLNSRWCPAGPILHRDRVLFMPSEEARLVCLDLYSGELLWQRGKGANLYVAGVTDDLLVTVGIGAIEGIGIADGVVRWSVPIPDDMGRPSGRAVLTEDHVYLPVGGDGLLQIDVARGELVAEKRLRSGEAELGNLVMHGGTLFSYSADGLTAFEERTELARRTDARLERDPRDGSALLRKAELLYSDGDTAGAADVLDRLDAAGIEPEDAERLRRLRWDVLVALIRSEPAAGGERLKELASLARNPEEQLTVRRLEADRASAAGEIDEAARAYLDLLKDLEADQYVSEDDGRRQVRLAAWSAGRLEDLWKSAEGESRAALDETFRNALRSAETDDDRSRLAEALAFHPAATDVEQGLAAADVAADRFPEAELRLLRLARSDEPAVVASAFLALADSAKHRNLDRDAWHWLDRVKNFDPETPLPDGTPLQTAIESRMSPETLGNRESSADLWGSFRLNVVRSGGYASSEPAVEVVPDTAELPFFRDRRLRLAVQQDRLTVSGLGGAGLEQIIPLRSGNRSSPQPVVIAEGHLLFVLYRGVVQAVSPAEGRVLWSVPVSDDAAAVFVSDTAPAAMRPAGSLSGTTGLIARSRVRGQMPAANASYVAVRGRGEIAVLDPMTGEVRWSRDDLPHGATIVGTESLIYVLPRDGDRRMALRALDGRSVGLGQAGRWLPHALAAVGDRLLTVVAEEPPFRLFDLPIGRRTVVSLRDPRTGRAEWTRAYAADALFDLNSDGRLCVLAPGGELTQLDPATGRPSPLGQVPTEILRGRSEAYLLTDADTAYLIVNAGRGPGFFAADMPTVPVSGHIFAFDRESGELRWRREVTSHRLLCQDFDHMPVLLLTDSERTEKGGQGLYRVDLLALDKRTGEPVLDEPYYMSSTPFFRDLTIQPERRSIELSAYNTRLRLHAISVSADEKPAPVSAPKGD